MRNSIMLVFLLRLRELYRSEQSATFVGRFDSSDRRGIQYALPGLRAIRFDVHLISMLIYTFLKLEYTRAISIKSLLRLQYLLTPR